MTTSENEALAKFKALFLILFEYLKLNKKLDHVKKSNSIGGSSKICQWK